MTGNTVQGRAGVASPSVALMLTVLILFIGLGMEDPLSPLQFQRDRILDQEWWRLLSAHLVHIDTLHMAGNAAALLAWGYFFNERESLASLGLRILACALIISLSLLFFSEQVAWMAGASGLIHALAAGSALRLVLERRWVLGGAILAALTLKILAEQYLGLVSWMEAFADYSIVSVAHGYGVAAGVIVELLRHSCRVGALPARIRMEG